MEEDSVPEIEGASPTSGHSLPPSISFVTEGGTLYNVNGACGKLGDNVQLGSRQVMVINSNQKPKKRKCNPKKPLSTNQTEPTRELLHKVSGKLYYEEIWPLGRELNLSDPRLDEIRVTYKLEGAPEIKYQVLAEWIKKDENPTVATLAKLLSKIGRGDIADILPR